MFDPYRVYVLLTNPHSMLSIININLRMSEFHCQCNVDRPVGSRSGVSDSKSGPSPDTAGICRICCSRLLMKSTIALLSYMYAAKNAGADASTTRIERRMPGRNVSAYPTRGGTGLRARRDTSAAGAKARTSAGQAVLLVVGLADPSYRSGTRSRISS